MLLKSILGYLKRRRHWNWCNIWCLNLEMDIKRVPFVVGLGLNRCKMLLKSILGYLKRRRHLNWCKIWCLNLEMDIKRVPFVVGLGSNRCKMLLKSILGYLGDGFETHVAKRPGFAGNPGAFWTPWRSPGRQVDFFFKHLFFLKTRQGWKGLIFAPPWTPQNRLKINKNQKQGKTWKSCPKTYWFLSLSGAWEPRNTLAR